MTSRVQITPDGTFIARCIRTGTTASGASQAEAEAELRRLMAGRRA